MGNGGRMRAFVVWLAALGLVSAMVVHHRHFLMVQAIALEATPPPRAQEDEGPAVRWADDWFTVEEIAPGTFAIGEPRYYQQNFSYLIIGSERAVLFDAGPGMRDLRPVVRSLTALPVLFVPSHFHYDHVGNQITFEDVAVIDLPGLRSRAPDGRLEFAWFEHLGAAEGVDAAPLEIDRWLKPGEEIELGGRELEVLYTPGHTPDSISLLDRAARLLLTGDFLYPFELYAFLPNSSLGDYQRAADRVLATVPDDARLFGAHREGPPGAPRMAMDDVRDLASTLRALSEGEIEGTDVYPVRYRVNDRLDLLAEPAWLARWDETHPGFGTDAR